MVSNWINGGPQSSRLHCKSLIKVLINQSPLRTTTSRTREENKGNCHEEDRRAGRINVVIEPIRPRLEHPTIRLNPGNLVMLRPIPRIWSPAKIHPASSEHEHPIARLQLAKNSKEATHFQSRWRQESIQSSRKEAVKGRG